MSRANRFAAAAEESRVSALEREVSQLRRALERSDRCIEELRKQVASPAGPSPCDDGASNKSSFSCTPPQTPAKQTAKLPANTCDSSAATSVPIHGCLSSKTLADPGVALLPEASDTSNGNMFPGAAAVLQRDCQETPPSHSYHRPSTAVRLDFGPNPESRTSEVAGDSVFNSQSCKSEAELSSPSVKEESATIASTGTSNLPSTLTWATAPCLLNELVSPLRGVADIHSTPSACALTVSCTSGSAGDVSAARSNEHSVVVAKETDENAVSVTKETDGQPQAVFHDTLTTSGAAVQGIDTAGSPFMVQEEPMSLIPGSLHSSPVPKSLSLGQSSLPAGPGRSSPGSLATELLLPLSSSLEASSLSKKEVLPSSQ